jgi:hypothetical protein
MGQGDLPPSPGGPLRRRREKRQLEHLAEESGHAESPATARRHVRVIEDQAGTADHELEAPATAGEPLMEAHLGGFHVRAVPIDQPFDEGATAEVDRLLE